MMGKEISFSEGKPFLELFSSKVEIPSSYEFHSVKKVKVDNSWAYLFRYQKQRKDKLRGEHFSFIVSESDKKILGFTSMDKKYANQTMLSKEKVKEIALKFLQKMDKSLSESLQNIWIERHDEEIILGGEKMSISGMKYKCYRSSREDYAWVIIGFDGAVITFERDILWDTKAQRRITEKWLHDNWLEKR